jgi:2-C-methyl-D-erythritol 2,4-cyclodiphosphate synthase
MHTPQCIRYHIAVKAFKKAEQDNFLGTDDVTLVERLGKKVKIVDSTQENIKITFPKDLEKARFIQAGTKIGYGLDSHRFDTQTKDLILGGVKIENEQGLSANSDGDVILHSLFNALSSAIGEYSISRYADDMYKDGIKDSKEYIKVMKHILKERNYQINNIAIAVEAKKPKLEKYAEKMKEIIAKTLSIGHEQIGITFTTGEELTDFGKGLGIKAESVVTVIRR